MKRTLLLFVLLMFAMQALAATRVVLMVIPGCQYCATAKQVLDRKGIEYRTQVTRQGPVPRLYVNGQLQGVGLDAVENWVATQPARR